MIKLVVSDLDGTLLPYGQIRVSETVENYIERIIEGGAVFAVSSGRTYSELASILSKFKDKIYFICSDGAYYIKGGKALYERSISVSDLALFKTEDGRSYVFHGANKNYSLGNTPDAANAFNAEKISRIGEIKEKIFKVTSFGGAVSLPAYCGLRMHWDGGANQSAQYVNRFCDKGAALSDLQMRLMLTKFDTACMGDSGNDIAMMHNAKHSICIGARSAELASVCTGRADKVEDALLKIIDLI